MTIFIRTIEDKEIDKYNKLVIEDFDITVVAPLYRAAEEIANNPIQGGIEKIELPLIDDGKNATWALLFYGNTYITMNFSEVKQLINKVHSDIAFELNVPPDLFPYVITVK